MFQLSGFYCKPSGAAIQLLAAVPRRPEPMEEPGLGHPILIGTLRGVGGRGVGGLDAHNKDLGLVGSTLNPNKVGNRFKDK